MNSSRKRLIIIGTLVGCLAVAVISQWGQGVQQTNRAVITFFDVGQGDGIHIRSTDGVDIIIDGGPDDSIISQVGSSIPFWDRTIELVVISHADADHITGLVPLFDYYHIEQLMVVDIEVTTAVYLELMQQVELSGTDIIHPTAGDRLQLSQHEYISILYPFVDTSINTLPRNDTSIVMEYHYLDTSVLLTGDISKPVEQELVQANVLSDIDILKVAHHGSKSSSYHGFLSATQPEVLVVQLGEENQFGHPHEEVLHRLYEYGPVVRNDEHGTIQVMIDETGYWFDFQM